MSEQDTILQEVERRIEAALSLVGRDEADDLIKANGKKGIAIDKVLVQAVQSQHQLFLGMLTQIHGMPESPDALLTFAKHQGVILQLIHNAYAVGLKRGREES